jgi:hypothetical protein
MPKVSASVLAYRELLKHLERAELSLGDVKASGQELVKANAAFEDVVASKKWLAEVEFHARA